MKVKEEWQRASTNFQPTVTIGDKTILDKLVTFWDKATRIAWKKITSSQDIIKFEEQLDKFFDITKCRCLLLHCEEANCPGCPKSSSSKFPACHLFCECPAEQKIPVLERSFILAQREKVGTKSTIMIQNIDKKKIKYSLKNMKYSRK